MADLMLVAARTSRARSQPPRPDGPAAGIHLNHGDAASPPYVITGTIKANFPTRISFQVTSKIDSRTILFEMGAEQLLGQGDMLYMAGGDAFRAVPGPFVFRMGKSRNRGSFAHAGQPQYLDAHTSEDEAIEALASRRPAPAR